MKRIFIITLAFCIMSLPFLSGCTANIDGESCRGLGYEFGACYAEACSCIAVEDEWSEMYDIYDSAVEGVDYSKPSQQWYKSDQYSGVNLTVSMDIYNEFVLYKFEILFIQDGIILDKINVVAEDANRYVTMSVGNYTSSFDVDLTDKKDNSGEVYYIVNSFVANKKR